MYKCERVEIIKKISDQNYLAKAYIVSLIKGMDSPVEFIPIAIEKTDNGEIRIDLYNEVGPEMLEFAK